jgi:soluble lytic murein transglycosylase-like protein
MNLTLGQVLSSAGRVGAGWRQEEEAQRVAQQNQLKIEEQNRLNRLRQEMTQAPMPQTPDLMGQFARPDVQQVPVAPVAAPQITAPIQPAVQPAPAAQKPAVTNQDLAALNYLRQQDAAKMPTTPPVAVPKSPYAISTTKGSYVDKVSPDALRGGLAPSNIMTQQSAIMSAEQKKLDALKGKPSAGTVDQQKLLAAQQQVESGGKTTAVSPKGATGLMQVMPETAMDPGFGLPNVFDFAASKGIQVGKRDANTAAALLKMPEVGAEYGNMYSLAMAQKYGNNQTLQLIAYNMGPTATDKWLAAGGDMTKLPKETRDYVTKTLSLAGGEQPSVIKNVPITPDGQIVKVADTKPPTPAVQKKVSDFYLANPEAIGGDMQRALRQRDELTRLAGMYQRSGMGMQYMELRNKIIELDEGMFYLQGMQGLQDLALANDPRRLSAVASHYAGTPIAFQPRTDGTYNVFVNGTMTKEGIGVDEVSDLSRRSFDSGYRQIMAQVSSEASMKRLDTSLDIMKENAKAYAKMIADVTVEGIKGQNTINQEMAKAKYGLEVKPSGAADGGVFIKPAGSTDIFYYNPTPTTIEIDGVKIESRGAHPIANLPSLSWAKGTI